jgi:hypothetical protein
MRATLLAGLLLAAGCTLTPDVSAHRPKLAADCPGQKVCGDRCVDQDDPIAGCGPVSCLPCPAAPANAVPICGAGATCGSACAPGFADCDGDPSNGCEKDVSADDANCGACGHACAGCAGGLCPVATVTTTGMNPRGIGVSGTTVAWGEPAPPGFLFRCDLSGKPLAGSSGFGQVTWVRASGSLVAVAGSELLLAGERGAAWLYNPGSGSTPPTQVKYMSSGTEPSITGLALGSKFMVGIIDPLDLAWQDTSVYWNGRSTPYAAPLRGVGDGGGGFWIGGDSGVHGLNGLDASDEGLLVPFAGLPRTPHADRLAARNGPASTDPKVVYFADLADGSIWTGLSNASPPFRLVRGDGPRSQLDLAADDKGLAWSDLDRGEIWAVPPGGHPYLLARGRPWAIALTADKVWWTDVDAREIRTVPR